jgi:hypothetical protein
VLNIIPRKYIYSILKKARVLFSHVNKLLSDTKSSRLTLFREIAVERPRRRWEDNVKMDLQEVGCGCGDWIGLAQDRDTWRALVSAVRNLRFP